MSFILDAIAKSEQERQQQHTPDASRLAFPAAVPARSRGLAPWALAGVLLLGIATLAAIWMHLQRPPVTPFVGSGGSSMPAVPEATHQPPAPVESRDAPPPAAPAETPTPESASQMLAESAAAASVARTEPPVVEETDLAAALDPALAAPVKRSSADRAPADEAGTANSRQASLETDSASPPPETEAPRRRVSRLSDLPVDVRRVLPSVVFTGHLYSRNPRASYVFIDGGRQVVAGQQITDELLLDEITPTGVVVEFQGYLIEVGVLQNWSLK